MKQLLDLINAGEDIPEHFAKAHPHIVDALKGSKGKVMQTPKDNDE